MLTRRRWLIRGLCAVAAGTLGWTFFVEPHWMSVSRFELRIPNLPAAWIGRRLVHVSDLHAGRVSPGYLRRAMQEINRLEPDVICMTGDFIDSSAGVDIVAEVLSELRPAKLATIGCLGNHDYSHGWQNVRVADQVATEAARHGIRVLSNELLEIDGMTFVGLDDYWGPRFRPDSVLRSIDENAAAVCLCHNPDVCDLDVWGDFQGAILSGHTHGGQCKPPFLPPPMLPVKNKRYTAGFFRIDARRELFVTRGIGHTMKVRFNCPPEIVEFTLRNI